MTQEQVKQLIDKMKALATLPNARLIQNGNSYAYRLYATDIIVADTKANTVTVNFGQNARWYTYTTVRRLKLLGFTPKKLSDTVIAVIYSDKVAFVDKTTGKAVFEVK